MTILLVKSHNIVLVSGFTIDENMEKYLALLKVIYRAVLLGQGSLLLHSDFHISLY